MVARRNPPDTTNSETTESREIDRLNAQLDAQLGDRSLARDKFDDDTLADVNNIDDAMQLLGGEFTDSIELGSGFQVAEDKDQFIKRGLMFIQWRVQRGDQGLYTSAHVVTEDGGKFVINDGSHGIHRQLAQFTARTGRNTGLLARRGLTRSDYKYTDERTGEEKPASTYYIA